MDQDNRSSVQDLLDGNRACRKSATNYMSSRLKANVLITFNVALIDAERRVFAPGLALPHLTEIGNHLSAQMYQRWATCSEPQIIPSPGLLDFNVPKLGTNGEVTFEKD